MITYGFLGIRARSWEPQNR